jgi:hypothetical protein
MDSWPPLLTATMTSANRPTWADWGHRVPPINTVSAAPTLGTKSMPPLVETPPRKTLPLAHRADTTAGRKNIAMAGIIPSARPLQRSCIVLFMLPAYRNPGEIAGIAAQFPVQKNKARSYTMTGLCLEALQRVEAYCGGFPIGVPSLRHSPYRYSSLNSAHLNSSS